MSEENSNLPDNMEQAEEAEPPPYTYPSQAYSQHPALTNPTNPPISHPYQPPCYSQQTPYNPQFPATAGTVQYPPPCAYDPGMPQYPQTQPQYYTPLPQHQQQTSNMVVLGGQATQIVYAPPRPYTSFACAIVLSVLVFLFCGYLFGLIALILALVGQSSANDENARLLLRVSYGLSIAGIITGAIIYITVFALVLTPERSSSYPSITPSPSYRFITSTPPFNCGSYGYYYDSNKRKTCCQYSNYNCLYGSYYNLNGIRTCCPFR